MRKPRKVRPNQRFEGYDSKFEHDLHQGVLKGCTRDPSLYIEYNVARRYFPDFVLEIGDKKFYIECKGRFWDSEEYSKYRHVRESLKANEEIIFIFYNPDYPMPRAQVKKKTGRKTSHADWAEANNFRWFTSETFKESIL